MKVITTALATAAAVLTLSGCGTSPENPATPTTVGNTVIGAPITIISTEELPPYVPAEGEDPAVTAAQIELRETCNVTWEDQWGTWTGCVPDPSIPRDAETGAFG